MYEKYFNFSSRPFAMNPDPGFLYPSSQHATALTMLEYAVESQAPFCLLTGEIGSGKTTLLRHFLRSLGMGITVGLISNTHSNFRSIHPWVLSSLGISPSVDTDIARYEALMDFFVGEYAKKRRTLLVLDEAHNLSPGILEELRLLSNVNSEKDVSLQVLLIGQPELRDKLAQPELQQFAQRVSVDFHLGPLLLDEARAYIQHRVKVAAGDPSMFEPEAIAFIHARTGGVPRLINQFCDLALVYAFAESQKEISLKLLQQVLPGSQDTGRHSAVFGQTADFAGAGGVPRARLTILVEIPCDRGRPGFFKLRHRRRPGARTARRFIQSRRRHERIGRALLRVAPPHPCGKLARGQPGSRERHRAGRLRTDQEEGARSAADVRAGNRADLVRAIRGRLHVHHRRIRGGL